MIRRIAEEDPDESDAKGIWSFSGHFASFQSRLAPDSRISASACYQYAVLLYYAVLIHF